MINLINKTINKYFISNISKHQETVINWIYKITKLETKPQAKIYSNQLASLMNYYMKKTIPVETVFYLNQQINWNQWQQKITTPGLVDKVKKNYLKLSKQKYNIENIVQTVFSKPTETLSDFNYQLKYHQNLWKLYYVEILDYMMKVQQFDGFSNYMWRQVLDFFPIAELHTQHHLQTHNYFPGSKSDINILGYIGSQFNFGKKVITFYRHPSQEHHCQKSTKSVLGR